MYYSASISDQPICFPKRGRKSLGLLRGSATRDGPFAMQRGGRPTPSSTEAYAVASSFLDSKCGPPPALHELLARRYARWQEAPEPSRFSARAQSATRRCRLQLAAEPAPSFTCSCKKGKEKISKSRRTHGVANLGESARLLAKCKPCKSRSTDGFPKKRLQHYSSGSRSLYARRAPYHVLPFPNGASGSWRVSGQEPCV